MPGIWEVTLGEEGAGMRQEIGLKPPKGPDCPWEVGALEPGRLGQSAILWRRPRPAPKSTPSLPDLCNRDPSGPSIFRPLKDQCSFPAVSYQSGADPGAQQRRRRTPGLNVLECSCPSHRCWLHHWPRAPPPAPGPHPRSQGRCEPLPEQGPGA